MALEAEMDAFWKEHEEWMQASHTVGLDGDDAVAPRVLHFHIAKGAEKETPLDPASKETGNLLYIMSETYAAMEGIGKHMAMGGTDKAEWFKKLTTEYIPKYGFHVDMGQSSNLTSFADNYAAPCYQKGDATVHCVWKVPSDKESEMDAFWKEHEAWMRVSHAMTREGTDDEKPRLTSFNIRKGAELADPFDGKSAPTGKLMYTMSETYVAGSGIAKHMELGNSQKAEWFKKMLAYQAEHGVMIEVGHCSVFTSMEKPGPFKFDSGYPCCVTSNPESYTVLAEIPGQARMVLMKVAPGGADVPHEHPSHSMYFLSDAKLSIRDGPKVDMSKEGHVVEVPAGAAPIFPAGAHQVTNVGDKEVSVLFVEGFPVCKPCGTVDGFKTPFETSEKCYKILAENEDWITGELNIAPGEADVLHNHRDHLIYVVEGDEITIYEGGDEAKAHPVPIAPGAGIPAPIAAGPIFAHHNLKNTGKGNVKMIFFEMKK